MDDPKQRCPDIALAKSILKWEPTIQLKEGIEKTAAYFKQIL
jgi:UDP-glucuronate decarboxylase